MIRLYRIGVLALAVFYFAEQFVSVEDWSEYGWQFRFLTIWGLTLSLFSAFFMWRLTTGTSRDRHEVFASVTVVVNGLLVFLYWKIYLTDPFLFYEDGIPSAWWREYYLHALGPLLQWIDAFFFLGVFRPLKAIAFRIVGVILAYICWIELVIAPLNSTPTGTVTSGLPYLFLNSMQIGARMMFYAQTAFMTALFLFGGVILAWVLRRFGPTRA